MRIRAENKHTGLGSLSAEFRVHDSILDSSLVTVRVLGKCRWHPERDKYIHSLIVGHLKLLLRTLRRVHIGFDLRDVYDARIHDMVPCKPEAIISQDFGLAHSIIPILHALFFVVLPD